MQLILDNIVATIIAASITLMLMTAQHNNQLAAVESTVFYMLEQQMIDFQSVVRRDMQNVRAVESVQETDSAFVFYAQTSPTDTTRKKITYQRKKVGSRVMSEDVTLDLFQIVRLEDDVPAGGSIGTVIDWKINALNEEGTQVTLAADAAQISVSMAAVLPIDVSRINSVSVDESRWDATYHPRLLRETTL